MSTPQNSQTIQARLEGIRAEADNFIGRLESLLEQAKSQRLTEQHQQELQTQIDSARTMYGGTISKIEAELKAAQEAEAKDLQQNRDAQEAKATRVKESMKRQMLSAWLQAGGDPDVFDTQFPQLYAAEMTKRALGQVSTEERRGQDTVISKNF